MYYVYARFQSLFLNSTYIFTLYWLLQSDWHLFDGSSSQRISLPLSSKKPQLFLLILTQVVTVPIYQRRRKKKKSMRMTVINDVLLIKERLSKKVFFFSEMKSFTTTENGLKPRPVKGILYTFPFRTYVNDKSVLLIQNST